MRPRARLQNGPYDIVKIGVGIKAVRMQKMKKETRDKRKRVQKYLSHAHSGIYHWRNSFGSKMEACAEYEVFARFDYRSPTYEFKILRSQGLAGANRSNDFQTNLAGLAVSSQNDHGRQKT